jgi:hypothetical protein
MAGFCQIATEVPKIGNPATSPDEQDLAGNMKSYTSATFCRISHFATPAQSLADCSPGGLGAGLIFHDGRKPDGR